MPPLRSTVSSAVNPGDAAAAAEPSAMMSSMSASSYFTLTFKVWLQIWDAGGENSLSNLFLSFLFQKREIFQDLAPLLWHSFGTVAALLQEIMSIYPSLSPPTLSPVASNRVCNALALLQCVASHPETRIPFLNAHIPLYLYPFLNTTSKTRPFEYLRLTSLGVIGALVKVN
ncbi:CCR4-NOT transcription complex subunit 9-like [Triticum aestivum]|uniref:CCR4-NOT transcription complex subunit 9-like n=1 Tax=Triticum aestivum TaxID=4565 RepID=UPI001D022758|nr:CCR4-NOT transcription complex subunit 9-like [Triticum aestivum]